jgi:hypothetical protein
MQNLVADCGVRWRRSRRAQVKLMVRRLLAQESIAELPRMESVHCHLHNTLTAGRARNREPSWLGVLARAWPEVSRELDAH